MKERLALMLVDHDKIFVRSEKSAKIAEVQILTVNPTPNTPHYHYLWESRQYAKQLQQVLFHDFRMSSFFRLLICVILPDDASTADADTMIDFLRRLCSARIQLANFSQCLCPSLGESRKFISLTQSEKSIILQYHNNGWEIATVYFDREESDVSKLRAAISNLHEDCSSGQIPVLIQERLSRFSALGEVVSNATALDNLENYVRKLK